MSCLSDDNIVKELGKNIYIYPFNPKNIKGSTINLTASKYAWSLKNDKKRVKILGKKLIIEPKDTILIETEECIYVSDKICGDYHSRVRMVSKGLGHIGTTLDPKYIGPSLIALHNNSEKSIEIEIGESIVSIMFYYLENKSTVEHNNSSGQLELLNDCEDFNEIDKYFQEDWTKTPSELKKKMVNSKAYKEFLEENSKKHNWKNPFRAVIIYFITLLGFVILITIEYFIEKYFTKSDQPLKVFNTLTTIGLSGIVGALFIRITEYFNKK